MFRHTRRSQARCAGDLRTRGRQRRAQLRTLARRDGDDLATEIDGARLLTWRASWMAKLYNIFEGTSEIQRIVISNALGAAE